MNKPKTFWDKPISEVVNNVYVKKYAVKTIVYSLGILAITGIVYYISNIITTNNTTDTGVDTTDITSTAKNVTNTPITSLNVLGNIPIFPLICAAIIMSFGLFAGRKIFWATFLFLQMFLFISLGWSVWALLIPLLFIGMHYLFEANEISF